MAVLIFLYGMFVVVAGLIGLLIWWISADEGTQSYNYKIAKTLVKYAIVFPYAVFRVIKILEQESRNNDV